MEFDTLLIDALTPEWRIAMMSGGQLQTLEIIRPGSPHQEGDIVFGRVTSVVKGMRGAFVDIGENRDGFLPFQDKDKSPPVTEGEKLPVQIRNEQRDDKGARLSAKITFRGQYSVFLPGQPGIGTSKKASNKAFATALKDRASAIVDPQDGVIVRTAALELDEQNIGLVEGEITTLRDQWFDIKASTKNSKAPTDLYKPANLLERVLNTAHVDRIVVEGAETFASVKSYLSAHRPDLSSTLKRHSKMSPLFQAEGVEEQIDEALLPQVNLPSGGRITIVPTPACITIDVDSAGASLKGGRAEVINTTNFEACKVLMQQLRLRNLSGHIVIDFISSKNRAAGKALLSQLTELGDQDTVPFEVAGFTRFGLVECLRQRGVASLPEIMCGSTTLSTKSPLSIAYVALRTLYSEGRANPGRKLSLNTSPTVCSLLEGVLLDAYKAVQVDLGVSVELISDGGSNNGHNNGHNSGRNNASIDVHAG